MNLDQTLSARGHNQCELCQNSNDPSPFGLTTPPTPESALLLCKTCRVQALGEIPLDAHHWRCLSEAIWSEHRAVKIMSYRLLTQLGVNSWARDLLDQLYLEAEDLAFAREGLDLEANDGDTDAPTLDSNGTRLQEGDSVTLIKDLEVKGGGFTAKRGTLVKNIKLGDNPKNIEGRVNGIQIVLVAAFLKKS